MGRGAGVAGSGAGPCEKLGAHAGCPAGPRTRGEEQPAGVPQHPHRQIATPPQQRAPGSCSRGKLRPPEAGAQGSHAPGELDPLNLGRCPPPCSSPCAGGRNISFWEKMKYNLQFS